MLAKSFLASYLLALQQPLTEPEGAAFQDDPIALNFNVPPKDAIEYFKKKKIVPKKQFNKLSREAKSASFSVSRVYKEDVLKGFKQELHDALDQGRTQQQTIKRFHEILSGAGHKQLGSFHLETVFRTNMQTSYGVGRRQALEDVKDDLPFWTYHTAGDDRVRVTHRLNGLTLPADNEFWDDHYPPWAFNCRCSVTASAEIPDDYDARNPSGLRNEFGDPLIQISYDKRGVPAKAEIGTTLYDLQVGNFAGIPRGASLLSAIEAGVGRARNKKS
ncbi:MAG TPA: phage minor head protein [Pyrinomonadaceae bacterium]|nr:phage minor head protein [Pyrinomonadaceae bacterium]